jgi:hypothetical protein
MESQMICPHCLVAVHVKFGEFLLGRDVDFGWRVDWATCPACGRFIVFLQHGEYYLAQGGPPGIHKTSPRLVHPRASSRPPCPKQVTDPIAEDYREACLVLADSPKASAALSRRCLQNLLREKAGVTPSDLFKEIQQVLDSGRLPSHIAEAVDGIRNIGNFAAHPQKSKTTGEILPVEPGEALWNLDVLEALFDFFYVQPDLLAKRRAALNAKLAEAGKPPMK